MRLEQRMMQEQIDQAKSVSILNYLRTNEPQALKRIGRYYTTVCELILQQGSGSGIFKIKVSRRNAYSFFIAPTCDKYCRQSQ